MISHFDGASGEARTPEQKPDGQTPQGSFEELQAWLKERRFDRDHFTIVTTFWTTEEREAAKGWLVAGMGDLLQLPSEIERSIYILGKCGCMATAMLQPATVASSTVLLTGLTMMILRNNNDALLHKLIQDAISVTVNVIDAQGNHCIYTFTRTEEYVEPDNLPDKVYNLEKLLAP
jgi:hypothetical protein